MALRREIEAGFGCSVSEGETRWTAEQNTFWDCSLRDGRAPRVAWDVRGCSGSPGEGHSPTRAPLPPKPFLRASCRLPPARLPRGPLSVSLSHARAHTHTHVHTHRHKHRHDNHTPAEFTLLPSSGQETAQCSEAPFSIFVVMSAWLLREREGVQAAQAGEEWLPSDAMEEWLPSDSQGSGLGSARGARSGAAPTAAGAGRGQPSSAPPPRGPASPAVEGAQGSTPSLPSFLCLCQVLCQDPRLLARACILPVARPGVPAWLPATCRSRLLGDPPPSPLSRGGGGGGWRRGGAWFPVPSSRCAAGQQREGPLRLPPTTSPSPPRRKPGGGRGAGEGTHPPTSPAQSPVLTPPPSPSS